MKLLVVDRIQPQSNKFVMGVKNEATCHSKLNDSPALVVSIDKYYNGIIIIIYNPSNFFACA